MSRRKSIIYTGCCLIVCFYLMGYTVNAYAEPDKIYSFGIVPQKSPSQIAKEWGPFIRYLQKKTGIPLKLGTAQDIPTFENRLNSDEYDLAYVNPLHYTDLLSKKGYVPFAHESHRKLKGVILVNKNSFYKDIKELNGNVICFPGPLSFAATILVRTELQNRGISIVPKYVNSHDSVYIDVARNICQAGGGVIKTYDEVPGEIKEKLKILWASAEYTPHPFVFKTKSVPMTVASRLADAMITLKDDPEGKKVLEGIGFKEIQSGKDSDYNDIRNTKLIEFSFQ